MKTITTTTILSTFVIVTICFTVLAQERPFTSAPIHSWSFTNAPTANTPGYNFTWQRGEYPFTGLAYLTDGQYIDLKLFRDDNGTAITTLGNSLSFEFWGSVHTLENYYCRWFEMGNGRANSSLTIAMRDQTNALYAAIYRGTTVSVSTYATEVITPNSFQHIVVVWNQLSLTDSTSATAAKLDLFVNGVLVNSRLSYLPEKIDRIENWLGRSEWNDDFFDGWYDDFHIYEYGLNAQQVAAHFCVSRPPRFEVAFGEDPRVIQNLQSATYSFILDDPDDYVNGTNFFQGVLRLNASASNYVDLATRSGSSSVGTSLPQLGGNGYSDPEFVAGWSFEMEFKITATGNNAKLFHFTDSTGANAIYLGMSGTSSDLQFHINNSLRPSGTPFTVIPNLTTNTWYHLVIIVNASNPTTGTASYVVFVNGNLTATTTDGTYPNAVERPIAYIGRSASTSDAYMGANIDSMRIYDYALKTNTIGISWNEPKCLYHTTNSVTPPQPSYEIPEDIYTTKPALSYMFSRQPVPSELSRTNYTWYFESSDGTRHNVAEFDGTVRNLVHLNRFEDDEGRTMPVIGATALSFTAWVNVQDLHSYSRIMDLGGLLGAAADNLILCIYTTSPTFRFNIYQGNVYTYIQADNSIILGKWQHVAATVSLRNPNDTTSATAASVKLYVDGVLSAQGYGYYPKRVARPNAFLARSNFGADLPFEGFMSSFHMYQYELNAQQIAAHASVVKPPVFELAFSSDPSQRNTSITYAYGWTASDGGHDGILTFNGVDQYLNLTSYNGRHTVGTIVPTLGGVGVGIDPTRIGITFELSFKITALNNNAKIFNIGNSEGVSGDVILLGQIGTTSQLGFEVFNSRMVRTRRFIVLNNFQLNQWYHLVIAVRPIDQNVATAIFTAYVNGEYSAGDSAGTWPDRLPRLHAAFGKSLWSADAYFAGSLDTFRIYDYALDQDDAAALNRTSGNLPPFIDTPRLFDSRPQNVYAFARPPTAAEISGTSDYTWTESLAGRNGLASFNGATQYLNLRTYRDIYGNTFPAVMGGEFTLESWVYFKGTTLFARVFEVGSAQARNIIAIAQVTATLEARFSTYNGTGAASAHAFAANGFPLNTWVHVAATIAIVPQNNPFSIQAANMSLYINGVLATTRLGYIPSFVARGEAYIGVSHWNAEGYLNGSVDYTAWWNYALSTESILVHKIIDRPPIIEFDFATDRRSQVLPSMSNPGYNWLQTDPDDVGTLNVNSRRGLLSLIGGGQYVSLSQSTGNYTTGSIASEFGGRGSGIVGVDRGVTIEVVFKPLAYSRGYSKVFSIGNGASVTYSDNVVLGFVGTSALHRFEVHNSRTQSSSLADIVNVTIGQWYAITITMTPNEQYTSSTWNVYMNGQHIQTLSNMQYPQSIQRRFAYLGKSEWSQDDGYTGVIDSFRIYDYVLNDASVAAIYNLAPIYPGNPRSSSSSSTGGNLITSSSNILAITSFSATLTTSSSSSNVVTSTLSCSYTGNVPAGSIEAAILLEITLQQLYNIGNFGNSFLAALQSYLEVPLDTIRCSYVYASGRQNNALAEPTANQVRLHFLLLNNNANYPPSVSFKKIADNFDTTFNAKLREFNIASPVSGSLHQKCADGTFTSPSCDVSSTDDGSSDLSGGAIAGIVIGVIVGVIILLIFLIYICKRTKKSSGEKHTNEDVKNDTNWDHVIDDQDQSTGNEEFDDGIEMTSNEA